VFLRNHLAMNVFHVPFTWSTSPRPRRRLPVVPPVPRPFDFGLAARSPLVPLAVATLFLNRKPRGVLALIESGDLRWAFDIRSSPAASREVRILRDSLFEYTRLVPRECYYDSDQREFADLLAAILPGRKLARRPAPSAPVFSEPPLPASVVAQCFSCSAGHIHNLVRDRLLREAERRAPGNQLYIHRASVVEFLWKRRMT
jgi:hypothetical protein